MLAHEQSSEFNGARLAAGLGVSAQTVSRYLDLLVDLMLIRRLPAWFEIIGKRLRKSPRVVLRHSGIVHALLGIDLLLVTGSERIAVEIKRSSAGRVEGLSHCMR